MKKILILLLLSSTCFSQTVEDSLVTVKKTWYARTMILSLTTGGDTNGETLTQRMTQNVEFGRSIGVIDVGISLGNFNSMVTDSSSTKYAQLRINMNACQFGIFSNELSVGAGYMFDSKTPVMLEISSTVFAQIGEQWGAGLVFGNYDFVGDKSSLNKNFFGLYLRWGLLRNEGGVLTSRIRMIQKNKRHHNRRRI